MGRTEDQVLALLLVHLKRVAGDRLRPCLEEAAQSGRPLADVVSDQRLLSSADLAGFVEAGRYLGAGHHLRACPRGHLQDAGVPGQAVHCPTCGAAMLRGVHPRPEAVRFDPALERQVRRLILDEAARQRMRARVRAAGEARREGRDPGRAEGELAPRAQAPEAARRKDGELGPYRLLEELGRGSSSYVYKARDARNGELLALKVLYFAQGEEEAVVRERVARFEREARLSAGLEHPNLVPARPVERVDGWSVIPMMYVDGPSLETLLQAGAGRPGESSSTGAQVDPLELAAALIDVARGLHFAHAQGVIHRDVNPRSILFSSSGHPYLSDFGAARPLGEVSALTGEKAHLGQIAYAAPERLRSERNADARSDVYGLGATLYRVLTGRLPFEAAQPNQLLAKILKETPPEPSRVRPGLPLALDAVCRKALDRDPARRHAGALEFAHDLAAALEGDAAPSAAGMPAWRKPVPAWWVAVAAGIGFVLGVAVMALARPAAPARTAQGTPVRGGGESATVSRSPAGGDGARAEASRVGRTYFDADPAIAALLRRWDEQDRQRRTWCAERDEKRERLRRPGLDDLARGHLEYDAKALQRRIDELDEARLALEADLLRAIAPGAAIRGEGLRAPVSGLLNSAYLRGRPEERVEEAVRAAEEGRVRAEQSGAAVEEALLRARRAIGRDDRQAALEAWAGAWERALEARRSGKQAELEREALVTAREREWTERLNAVGSVRPAGALPENVVDRIALAEQQPGAGVDPYSVRRLLGPRRLPLSPTAWDPRGHAFRGNGPFDAVRSMPPGEARGVAAAAFVRAAARADARLRHATVPAQAAVRYDLRLKVATLLALEGPAVIESCRPGEAPAGTAAGDAVPLEAVIRAALDAGDLAGTAAADAVDAAVGRCLALFLAQAFAPLAVPSVSAAHPGGATPALARAVRSAGAVLAAAAAAAARAGRVDRARARAAERAVESLRELARDPGRIDAWVDAALPEPLFPGRAERLRRTRSGVDVFRAAALEWEPRILGRRLDPPAAGPGGREEFLAGYERTAAQACAWMTGPGSSVGTRAREDGVAVADGDGDPPLFSAVTAARDAAARRGVALLACLARLPADVPRAADGEVVAASRGRIVLVGATLHVGGESLRLRLPAPESPAGAYLLAPDGREVGALALADRAEAAACAEALGWGWAAAARALEARAQAPDDDPIAHARALAALEWIGDHERLLALGPGPLSLSRGAGDEERAARLRALRLHAAATCTAGRRGDGTAAFAGGLVALSAEPGPLELAAFAELCEEWLPRVPPAERTPARERLEERARAAVAAPQSARLWLAIARLADLGDGTGDPERMFEALEHAYSGDPDGESGLAARELARSWSR